MTNNSINNSGMASGAEVLAGVNDTKMISPATFKGLTNTINITEHAMNLGFSFSAGVFTINAADGSALSALNPGYIKLQSRATPGLLKEYTLTANYTATIANMTNNLLGTTLSKAYDQDRPIYVYFMTNDAETTPIPFFCSLPSRVVGPVSGSIGQPSSAIADTQGAMWAFSAITNTLYDLNPCICIGSVRMRKDASNVWTMQALDQTDGPLQFKEKIPYLFPFGQDVAGAGTYLSPATPPTFSSLALNYALERNGICRVKYEFSGDGGTDGSGTSNTTMTPPFLGDNTGLAASFLFNGVGKFVTPTLTRGMTQNFNTAGLVTQFMRADTGGFVTNNLFPNGTRSMNGSFVFTVDEQ